MSAVMTDDELDYLHATTFGDGHLRLIREHKELRTKAKATQQMYEALEMVRDYVADAVRADGGIDHCEIGLRLDLEKIDAALKAASGEQE